jgi:hypothetical protein
VFKLHEDAMRGQLESLAQLKSDMSEKFNEMGVLSEKINETFERSIKQILGEGAARIGADMGDAIADGAREALTATGEYHSLRGQIMLLCFLCVVSSLAYWMGAAGFLESVSPGGRLEAILFLPAGWCVFFSGATYTFLWVGDHWGRIRKTALFKAFLGAQISCLALLAAALL